MRQFRIMPFMLLIVICLFLSTYSIADGGGPIPTRAECIFWHQNTSPNYDGPLINVNYTVSLDDNPNEDFFIIHAILKGTKLKGYGQSGSLKVVQTSEDLLKQDSGGRHNLVTRLDKAKQEREIVLEQLYAIPFPIEVGTYPNLCDYSADHFILKVQYLACTKEISNAYGYSNDKFYPYVTDVRITHKDHCHNRVEAIIAGTAKIRLSPIKISSPGQSTASE